MTDRLSERAALEDTLFLALTRPAMMWGVPSVGCLLNVTGSIIVGSWLGIGSWRVLAWIAFLMPSVHFAMRWAAARDHNLFRTKLLYLETKGRSGGTALWGGSSLTPLPGRWPRRAAELPISIGADTGSVETGAEAGREAGDV